MKENGQYSGSPLKKSMYQVWANYFVKFLDAYKKQGVTFWGITTGNEPGTGFLPFKIPSIAWTSDTQVRLTFFISYNIILYLISA